MDGAGDAAVAASRDHWWVQMFYGTRWLDLDPTMPDARPGDTLTAAQGTFDELPASVQQAVTVRVLAETLSGGQLNETTVLERRLVAADAATSTIYLMLQPAVAGPGGTIGEVLGSSTSWAPALYLGKDATTGTSFPITPGKDIFSDTTIDGPQVSRLTLEVAIDGPGQPSETHDSVLLDRVPPALRGSAHIDPGQLAPLTIVQGVPVDLVGIHHIQVSTGGFDARAHQLWRGLAAQLARLELSDPAAARGFRFPFDILPSAIGDETLVLTSEAFIRLALDAEPGLRAFVARPRVYVSSMGPTDTPGGLSLRTDLMADGVRLIDDGQLAPADLAVRHIWYAALQTALETQVMDQRAMAIMTGPIAQTGASQAMGQPLSVLGPGDVADLPQSASPRLVADLESGHIAVVPGDPGRSRVWWTIDPGTGETRSVVAPGYGGQVATGTITGHARTPPVYDVPPFLPPGEGVNGVVNTGPRIFTNGIDDPALTSEQMQQYSDRLFQQAEAQEAAQAEAAAESGCGGTEYTTTLCVALIAEGAFVALGIIVYGYIALF